MMDRRLLVLIVPLLLAGCTASPFGGGEASDAPPAQGLIIQQASLQNTAIPSSNGETELTLRLANTGTKEIDGAEISISNIGPLQIRGSPEGDRCDGGGPTFTLDVGAATEGVPREAVCRVTIEAAGAQEGQYPLTVRVQYSNTLRMQTDSPTVTFDDEQNLAATPVTRTYSNGEASLGVTVPPRVPVPDEQGSIELGLRFQNAGRGRLVAGDDELPAADISVDGGTLIDSIPAECSPVRIREGEVSGERKCTIENLPDISAFPSTHTLRLKADYRYERYRELPISVVEQD